MSEQPTWEERVAALRAKLDDLIDDIGMEDVVRKLGDISTEIAGLPGEIAGLRERGYAFASYLERKATVLAEQYEKWLPGMVAGARFNVAATRSGRLPSQLLR